jgi:hypothetical protein
VITPAHWSGGSGLTNYRAPVSEFGAVVQTQSGCKTCSSAVGFAKTGSNERYPGAICEGHGSRKSRPRFVSGGARQRWTPNQRSNCFNSRLRCRWLLLDSLRTRSTLLAISDNAVSTNSAVTA